MATFLENLQKTFKDLDFYSKGLRTGQVSGSHTPNSIIDYFQYAPNTDEEFDYAQKHIEKNPTYYTPFSWSDGGNRNIKGYVVSGEANDGKRILGVELENGLSLDGNGARKFFDNYRQKGVFKFAEDSNLWKNKENGDFLFWSGNPFDFNETKKHGTINNSGEGTFKVDAPNKSGREEGVTRLRDAMSFFKNLRQSKGQE